MKIILLLLCCLSFVAISKSKTYKDSYYNRLQLLNEVLYRVHDRLAFEDLRSFGKELNVDKTAYDFWADEMDEFLIAYQNGRLLPRGEFFGALIEGHAQQAHSLFLFFYNARSIEIMLKNICWAREHINEGIFFHAVNLLKFCYRSFQGYDLPLVHEVFPEYFFSRDYVLQAKKFNAADLSNGTRDQSTTPFKPWQWWRAMGLDNSWHAEHEFILRDTIYKRLNDQKYWNTLKGLKFWWLPVDYTREFGAETELSKMSYFIEDVEWNSFWYYLNLGYASQFLGDKLPLNVGHRGEFWLFTVQQLMTRCYFERLTHKIGPIPVFSWKETTKNSLTETFLVASTDESVRSNQGNDFSSNLFLQASLKFEKIEKAIEFGYYELKNGTKINLREPGAIEILGNLLQSNADSVDAQETDFNWYMQAMTSFSGWTKHELPNLMLNFETMLRDPLSYSFHQTLVDLYHKFKSKLLPYTSEQVATNDISIQHIEVSGFETFYDLMDYDISSLSQQKIRFKNDEMLQEDVLLARQMRLNHKTLKYNLTIKSEKRQSVIVHLFLGPQIDEHGKAISLSESSKNMFLLDQYKCLVSKGLNDCSRNSDEAWWTGSDRRTFSERYHYVRYLTAGFSYMPKNYDLEDACAFPKRLILPRGWKEGLPMRFIVVAERGTQTDELDRQNCRRRISAKDFGYPFDRVIIDESIFSVPNIRILDINITHVDPFETYFERYSNTGEFDYNFLNGYYHKNINYKSYRSPAK